ncbi:SDR family oxidoreductase [Salipaludibacillus keqinensis]|nr:SDR family oxidoreductase [Salipaludibacillus keqinensis]
MTSKIVLITGASSGFGFLTALALAKKHYTVIATMRNVEGSALLMNEARKQKISEKNLHIHRLDVTDSTDIEELKNYIQDTYGRLDILINNAGFTQGGVIEEVEIEQWEKQFQTNFFGSVAVTKAFIPLMRKQRSGKIILLGSISGRIGLPGLGPYAASKFALEGFSESLRFELKPFNIYTSLIEAGSFKTSIWQKGIDGAVHSDLQEYQSLMAFMNEYATEQGLSSEPPEKVVDLLCHVCQKDKPKFRYPVGKGIKLAIFLKSVLPWSIVEKILERQLKKKD